jgi:ribonuclease P protein component
VRKQIGFARSVGAAGVLRARQVRGLTRTLVAGKKRNSISRMFGSLLIGAHREAHISTAQQASQTFTRISQAHEDARRTLDAPAAPPQGTSPFVRDDCNQVVDAARPRLGLGRERRLRRRAEFLSVQRDGKRFETVHFLVFVRAQDEKARARLGVTVTRKVGGAVVRNRVKRFVKEVWRLSPVRWPDGLDVVVVAKTKAAQVTFKQAQEELDKLCRRLSGT